MNFKPVSEEEKNRLLNGNWKMEYAGTVFNGKVVSFTNGSCCNCNKKNARYCHTNHEGDKWFCSEFCFRSILGFWPFPITNGIPTIPADNPVVVPTVVVKEKTTAEKAWVQNELGEYHYKRSPLPTKPVKYWESQ